MKSVIFGALTLFLGVANAQDSSCTAENTETGAYCEISCGAGDAAYCENATENWDPICECRSGLGPKIISIGRKTKRFDLAPVISRTNVVDQINLQLAKFPVKVRAECRDVQIGRQCLVSSFKCPDPNFSPFAKEQKSAYRCPGDNVCSPVYEKQCTDVTDPLKAREPFLLESEPQVVIKQPNWDQVPTSFLGLQTVLKNCTSTEQTETYKHSETSRVGSRVTKTSLLETSNGLEIAARVEFTFGKIFKIGGGVNSKFSERVSITNGSEENREETRTLEHTLPIRVSPMKTVVVTHFFVQRKVEVPFSGSVQIDSSVTDNISGIKLASQILTAPEQRTFNFSGTVTDSSMINGNTTWREQPLTKADCDGSEDFIVESAPVSSTFIGDSQAELVGAKPNPKSRRKPINNRRAN